VPPFLVPFPVTPRRQPPQDCQLSLRRVGGVSLSLPSTSTGRPQLLLPQFRTSDLQGKQ